MIKQQKIMKKVKKEKYFFLYSLFMFFLNFSINFSYKPIDLYHEGQSLTPAFNNIINGGY